MTHDELVAWCRNHMTVRIPWRMVLAVLEIHKPRPFALGPGLCPVCTDRDGGVSEYPCPTVQAIEREVTR